MDTAIEIQDENANMNEQQLIEFINLKLASRGFPIYGREEEYPLLVLSRSLLRNFQEKNRLLSDYLCPADQRIQAFLDDYLSDLHLDESPRLPGTALVLERKGLARVLSLPPDSDYFNSDILESYRVKQGVLHNPRSDRRTTKGVFHVAEGGLPVPEDKKSVPKQAFAGLLKAALNPPGETLALPFTCNQENQARLFLSLLLRPTVVPEIPGVSPRKSLEIRFFAPGSLVSNLDFVESIFGNGGDPYLADNDAQLDGESWTGQTGCVILAPHLVRLTKKELGLPHRSQAGERQIRDGMCWEKETERYNDGGAFKITARDERGVIVTLIADNYFGYCKKEVKTQISYAANLYGLAEEEHAGGAIAFPSYDLGDDFQLSQYVEEVDHRFEDVVRAYGELMDMQPEGHGIDKRYPDIVYVPENVHINLRSQTIRWERGGDRKVIKLLHGNTYVLPSGYKVQLVKPGKGRRWRLVGTTAEGTFCHKPCTVSGGGKSEISKSIGNAILGGPVFIGNVQEDFALLDEIFKMEYGGRFKNPTENRAHGRPLLSEDRSLGSVIKLLTPNSEYTDEYNAWLRTIPSYIKELVFVVKRVHRAEWGDNWRRGYSVDVINGHEGKELKYKGAKLVTQYLRVGFMPDGSWRTFTLRKDFYPAEKLQMEDDISASMVVPRKSLQGLNPAYEQESVKLVENCESKFFQRPDEAIHRGYDESAEYDFSQPNSFFSNYHPMTRAEARAMVEDAILFDEFTDPIKRVIQEFIDEPRPDYLVASSDPRRIDGKATKNPRYLQNRPDLVNPRSRYLAEVGVRLFRRVPMEAGKVLFPVNAVLPGHRNNPPDPASGMRPLAVYNPIHFRELPELFMDFISSLTGKSPSTTGAGSEGALTKGPFNALPPIIDLNYALTSCILTGAECFSTAAGCVGPNYRVDHDISLLVPEIWARMKVFERSAKRLISKGYLEDCGKIDIPEVAPWLGRLGYRINEKFVITYFGRVFSNPGVVIPEEMLKPELQDRDVFIDGVRNIVETQRRVAENYMKDGSVEWACPPLKALLRIMASGDCEGKGLEDPEIRKLFTREYLISSDWYRERLRAKQRLDENFWKRQLAYMNDFIKKSTHKQEAERLGVLQRVESAKNRLAEAQSKDYLKRLEGSVGAEPRLQSR